MRINERIINSDNVHLRMLNPVTSRQLCSVRLSILEFARVAEDDATNPTEAVDSNLLTHMVSEKRTRAEGGAELSVDCRD